MGLNLLTEFGGWLELVANEFTPTNRVDVWRLVVDPLVVFIVPAIKVDKQQSAHAVSHGGHTHQPWLHQVHSL